MGRFDGRTVVVTGAAHGMGRSHAQAFAHEGAHVIVADIDQGWGERVAAELGPGSTFHLLDIAREDHWEALVEFVRQQTGRFDVLVNNAGILRFGGVETQSVSDFRRVIETNLVGTFLGLHYVLPIMRAQGYGSVINVGSTAALTGNPDGISYTASKWGLRGMTKSAATDMAGSGVRVNSVHPGFVRTDLTCKVSFESVGSLPVPRAAEPSEISALVLFLGSDESQYCTGSDFVIDGGLTSGPTSSYRSA